MPRAKRATASRGQATASKKQQQPISFGRTESNRITKPGASTRSTSTKKAADKAVALEQVDVSTTPTADSQHASEDEVVEVKSGEEEVSGVYGSVDSDSKIADATTSELAIREQIRQEEVAPRSAEEVEADGVSEAQIKKYWAAKEAERLTPRVHQEGLSLHEKILREFDLSYQYGPCIGIARTKRWKLAHELGLNPPIEVLSVLVKDDAKKNNVKVQRAYVDELMSSTFVVN